MSELIDKQAALDAIMGQPPEPHYPSWYAAQIEKLPAAQPDHNADIGKKVEGDCISRQAAIDAVSEYATIWMSYTDDMSASDIAQEAINSAKDTMIRILKEQPTVQPDHNADISKKAEGDCISRQEALKICRRYWHPTFNPIMEEIEKLPSVQPDRVIIDDCLHHIYKNISVHTATGGVIAIRYYMEKLYEEIYGKGERPWWMT